MYNLYLYICGSPQSSPLLVDNNHYSAHKMYLQVIYLHSILYKRTAADQILLLRQSVRVCVRATEE